MKTIILTILLLFMTSALYSQFEVSLQLVDNTGAFLNSYTSTEIKFRRSPYGSGDVVSGLTVTHPTGNLTGNYIVTGFPAYELVRLYISSTYQEWFGTKLVGDDRTYFGVIAGNNTWTGTNTFSNNIVFSTNVTNTGGEFRLNKPLWYDSSPWVSDYDLLTGNSMVSKNYSDSLYGVKQYFMDGSKLRLLTGVKIYGRTNTVAPILINTSQFLWNETDGLSLNTGLSSDSTASKNYTNKKDTTWYVLGEPVTKWRTLTLKKSFWAQTMTELSIPDWKWFYKSFNESGAVVAADSFTVMNDALDDVDADGLGLTTTYTEINSKILNKGLWNIRFNAQYDFVDASYGGGGMGFPYLDTISIIAIVTISGETDTLAHVWTTQQYNDGMANFGRDGVLSWDFIYNVAEMTRTIEIKARLYNFSSGLSHNLSKSNMNCILIR